MNQAEVNQLIQAALAQQESRFQSTITTLQAEISALRLKPSSVRPRLPDVDKFDGTLSMWEVWHPQIQAKLRIDAQALGDTDDAKFWYIYGRLEKKVQALVSPQLTTSPGDPQSLFDQLSRLCDDPNAKRKAADKLYGLRQFSDQTFNYFLAAFERLLYKSGANDWSDDAKISLIRRQINDRLKRRLKNQITVPTTYVAFVKVLQQLDASDDEPLPKTSDKKVSWQGKDKKDDVMDLSAMYIAGGYDDASSSSNSTGSDLG